MKLGNFKFKTKTINEFKLAYSDVTGMRDTVMVTATDTDGFLNRSGHLTLVAGDNGNEQTLKPCGSEWPIEVTYDTSQDAILGLLKTLSPNRFTVSWQGVSDEILFHSSWGIFRVNFEIDNEKGGIYVHSHDYLTDTDKLLGKVFIFDKEVGFGSADWVPYGEGNFQLGLTHSVEKAVAHLCARVRPEIELEGIWDPREKSFCMCVLNDPEVHTCLGTVHVKLRNKASVNKFQTSRLAWVESSEGHTLIGEVLWVQNGLKDDVIAYKTTEQNSKEVISESVADAAEKLLQHWSSELQDYPFPTRSSMEDVSASTSDKALPYNLPTLQDECLERFGLDPTETLNILDSLYADHEMITYPRTEGRHLMEAIHCHLPRQMLRNLSELDRFKVAYFVDPTIKSAAWNDEKVKGDYGGIIPDKVSRVRYQTLSRMEVKVFDLIATRFIEQFLPERAEGNYGWPEFVQLDEDCKVSLFADSADYIAKVFLTYPRLEYLGEINRFATSGRYEATPTHGLYIPHNYRMFRTVKETVSWLLSHAAKHHQSEFPQNESGTDIENDDTNEPCLYILIRQDMASLRDSTGKAVPQGCHAAQQASYEIKKAGAADDANAVTKRNFELLAQWEETTGKGFGVTIGLTVEDIDTLYRTVQAAKRMGAASEIVCDDTYPLVDGNVVHKLPVDTCAYVFGCKEDLKPLLGGFDLLP